MFLVDTLHQDGIGVFFAWSPAEFTPSEAGLAEFDGMPTFESDDSTRQVHPVSESRRQSFGSRGSCEARAVSSRRSADSQRCIENGAPRCS